MTNENSPATNFSVSLPFKTWNEIFQEFSTTSPSEAIEKMWDEYKNSKVKK